MSVTYRTDDEAADPFAQQAQDGELQHPTAEGRPVRRARHRRRLADSRSRLTPGSKERLRLVAWSLVGIGCLLTAHWIQPEHRLLFALPDDPVGWVALLFGVTGLWLVPGMWLSALVARTGAGQPAWLGTRIATMLIWYAVLGPVIHRAGEGAKVTTGGLLIATVAATGAVLIGVALGLSRWPSRRWIRVLVPAGVGALGAYATIWVFMRVWTSGMNYEHIRRLDWLIVACGALLVTLGTLSRPKLPAVRRKQQLAQIAAAIAVVAAAFGTIQLTSAIWSPAQRMPSVISAEQITAPAGADLAFALNVIGPEGATLFDRAQFTVTDAAGHPVPAFTSTEGSETSATQATLAVVLDPAARPMLCTAIQAPKLTVHDEVSGMRVQARAPDGWCAR